MIRHCLFAVFALAGIACAADVSDNFDGSSLSKNWSTKRFKSGAVEIQSQNVRAGKGAARITLRHGDWSEPSDTPGGPIIERAELEEARELWDEPGKAYSYAFGVFIPRDFPIAPTRLVIAQWKQKCPQDKCTPGSSLLAVRYHAGNLRITAGPGDKHLYRAGTEDVRGRWLDFKFYVRFAAAGRVKAWINGQQVVDYSGPTLYPPTGGYSSQDRLTFRMGLNRDQMNQPMTIFIDEYRKQELPAGAL